MASRRPLAKSPLSSVRATRKPRPSLLQPDAPAAQLRGARVHRGADAHNAVAAFLPTSPLAASRNFRHPVLQGSFRARSPRSTPRRCHVCRAGHSCSRESCPPPRFSCSSTEVLRHRRSRRSVRQNSPRSLMLFFRGETAPMSLPAQRVPIPPPQQAVALPGHPTYQCITLDSVSWMVSFAGYWSSISFIAWCPVTDWVRI